MDVRKMEFEDEMFNVVIDKGTLDSILVIIFLTVSKCANPSMNHVTKYLNEVDKVLELGGAYILITFGDPEIRAHFLKRDKWKFKVIEIPMLDLTPPKPEQPKNAKKKRRRRKKKKEEEKKVFYLYICEKGVIVEEDDEMMEDNGENSMEENNLVEK